MKNIYASMVTIKGMKKQPIKQEEKFTNHVSDKQLISRIYKKLL
jgi:hypothetical protein